MKDSKQDFVNRMEYDLQRNVSHNKISVEKIAAYFGITNKNEVKELTELAIVNRARLLAHSEGTVKERFGTNRFLPTEETSRRGRAG